MLTTLISLICCFLSGFFFARVLYTKKVKLLSTPKVYQLSLPAREDMKDLLELISTVDKSVIDPKSIVIFIDESSIALGISRQSALISAKASYGHSTGKIIENISISDYKEQLLKTAETNKDNLDKLIDKHKYLLE